MDDGSLFGSVLATFFAICIAVPLFVLFIWSVIWAYWDAERRGKPGCLVALLVLLMTWPVGLILWLLIRPSDKVGGY
ncbi:MAG: hypothetical protein ACE5E7_11910 [Anaerolineae bacterium]